MNGEAPQISYLTGEVLHLSDRTTVNLAQPYCSIARSWNEFVAIRDESSGVPLVEVLDAQGNVVESSAGGQAAAVSSPDGSIAAWVDADGNALLMWIGRAAGLGNLKQGHALIVPALPGVDRCSRQSAPRT